MVGKKFDVTRTEPKENMDGYLCGGRYLNAVVDVCGPIYVF